MFTLNILVSLGLNLLIMRREFYKAIGRHVAQGVFMISGISVFFLLLFVMVQILSHYTGENIVKMMFAGR